MIAAFAAVAFAQDNSESFYQVIRQNDLASLQTLVKAAGVKVKDTRGTTPLHHAAAYGSAEAVRLLLAAGADPNARNDFEVTPLMWAATEPEKVKLLVNQGADVNAKSKMGRTAIWIAAANDGSYGIVKFLLDHGAKLDGSEIVAAAGANDMATVKMLLDKGQSVNAKDPMGNTPLLGAATNGNTKMAELLLSRGADVNAANSADFGGTVKAGKLALGNMTPLFVSSTYGPYDLLRLLLDAGAKADTRDVRQMTPLMVAVATDHADPRIVRLLIERGVDPQAKDRDGLTAADWAKKQNNPLILKELNVQKMTSRTQQGPSVVIPVSLLGTRDPRPAATRSVELLQRASGSFFEGGGCGACHSANMTSIAVNAAKASGIAVNEKAKAAEIKGAQLAWGGFEQPLLQRGDPPAVDIMTYAMMQFASEGVPAGPVSDAVVHNLMAQQRQAGNWHMGGIGRPPTMDGDVSRTATAIRALALYAPAGRKAEAQKRIERAAAWLASAPIRNIDEMNMQLLGLKWAGMARRPWLAGLRKVAAMQRADGGWSQTPDLGSDAYATGLTLYTMHELGVPATDPVYRKGVQYLAQTQAEDGSWHVKSRAPKFQPYFDTIFPYGHDQWISSWATAWSAAALSYASESRQIAKR
jgi:ankyrin repeat protein